MMKRRSFLVGTSALTLAQLMSGCNSQQQASLRVRLLKDSIPAQLLGEFRKVLQQPAQLNFDPKAQLKDLFADLETWKQLSTSRKRGWQGLPIPFIGGKVPELANLVTLGNSWLEQAIQQQLIQPLDIQNLEGWKQLDPRWQEVVQRVDKGQLINNKDGQGDRKGQSNNKNVLVWGAPYRWGTTVIAYRRDKFKELGWVPTDWSDLWREELRDRISLLDQPREVIGLTLKKLKFSYNTDLSKEQVPKLKEELLALHQQVKYYSSNNYLEPLILGDTWVALGWSTDVLPLRSAYPKIDAVVPQSGTALWADVWVQPASVVVESNSRQKSDRASSSAAASSTQPTNASTKPSLMQQWIEFCWQPEPAKEISLLSNAASPIFASKAPDKLPKELQKNRLLLPNSSILDKSEFIEPLPKLVDEKYQALWKEIRSSNISS